MGILRKWVAPSRMHGSRARGLRKVEEGVPVLQYPPYDVARENVRICLSEVRQKNYTVVLRWRSIHNQYISFCVSANFNWTTQNLLFLYRNSRVIHESPG